MVIMQQNTGRPVQFEVTEQTRRSIGTWVEAKELSFDDLLFPSRIKAGLAPDHAAVCEVGG